MEIEVQKENNWKIKLENELKLRGFSRQTIKAYSYNVGKFLESGLEPKEYLLNLINKGRSKSTVRAAGFAIKFHLGMDKGQDKSINAIVENIPNVKNDKRLPEILSKNEIENMIIATENFRYRTMIQLMYSAGLRASELLSLRWNDIDFSRNIIHVKLGKGAKDRLVMLSPKVKKSLLKLGLNREGLVFRTNKNEKYSLRSLQLIIKNAARKAGISKRVTPHSLRHSFATHLLEHGTDIRYIKDLLGHSNIQTTMIYTKVSTRDISRIKSPLDL